MRGIIRSVLRLLLFIKRNTFLDSMLARSPRLVRLLRRLAGKSAPPFVENALGHKMYLDAQDSLCLSLSTSYEPFITRYFQQSIKEGNVVLDIGANIGFFTLLFAKLVGATGRVYAFEPDPDNFRLLSKNVEVNGYTNVTLVNQSVSDTPGTLDLFLCDENRGDHRTYDTGDGRRSIRVETLKLDDYANSFRQQIDLIKIDVQGAEYRALKGMVSLLAENDKVVIVTEFFPAGLKQSGTEPRSLLELLAGLGFSLFKIDEKTGAISKAEVDEVMSVCRYDSDKVINLICTKEREA